jgi:hypothetical protein
MRSFTTIFLLYFLNIEKIFKKKKKKTQKVICNVLGNILSYT